MRKLMLAATAAMLTVSGFAPPAFAQHGGSPEYQLEDEADYVAEGGKDADYDQDYDEDFDAGDVGDRRRALSEHEDEAPDGEAYQDGSWRGDDGRLYCRRSDGTTGTIIGGGAGALIGRGFDTRGERGTGTIIGAIVGALIGSAVERSARCR